MQYHEITEKLSKMNEMNRLGYVEARIKKIVKTENIEAVEEAIHMIGYVSNGAMCDYCIHDDFGYCDFRGQEIDETKMRFKYCFPAFLKYVEKYEK